MPLSPSSSDILDVATSRGTCDSAHSGSTPRDFGQQIAVEYWRQSGAWHVFSRQGKDKPCGLCLLPENTVHKERELYPPQPTIVSVVSDGRPDYYHFTAALSCGHGPVGFATTPQHAPQVGAPYSCWDCTRPVDERNQPGLPEDVRERIASMLPKCPTCGGAIDSIPFIKRTVHKFEASVDFQTGEIMAESEHHDTLEEVPDWRSRDGISVLEVTCVNDHSWFEDRLSYEYDHALNEHVWRVLEPR